MEKSPSWEANRFAASQEIHRILWNLNVHYRIHKCPPPLHILSQLDPVHTATSWRSTLILSSHLRLGLRSGLFPTVFPTKTLYTSLLSPIRATCPAYPIILDFITRTILGEEYTTLNSSLCSFLHSSVTSSLLAPNILLSTLFSNTLILHSSLNVSDQVSHPYKTTGKIIQGDSFGTRPKKMRISQRLFIRFWTCIYDYCIWTFPASPLVSTCFSWSKVCSHICMFKI